MLFTVTFDIIFSSFLEIWSQRHVLHTYVYVQRYVHIDKYTNIYL